MRTMLLVQVLRRCSGSKPCENGAIPASGPRTDARAGRIWVIRFCLGGHLPSHRPARWLAVANVAERVPGCHRVAVAKLPFPSASTAPPASLRPSRLCGTPQQTLGSLPCNTVIFLYTLRGCVATRRHRPMLQSNVSAKQAVQQARLSCVADSSFSQHCRRVICKFTTSKAYHCPPVFPMAWGVR